MKGTIKFLMTFKKSCDLEHLKNAIKGVTFDQFLQSFQTKATVEQIYQKPQQERKKEEKEKMKNGRKKIPILWLFVSSASQKNSCFGF